MSDLSAALKVTTESRGIQRPDGAPLHAYHLSDAEAYSLPSAVSAALSRWERLGEIDRLEAAGGFCLHASRRISEDYIGGPWGWALATTGLTFPRSGDVPFLHELVRCGLRYWGRAGQIVVLETTRYLMTLVSEGGLPLGVLELPNNPLSRFLEALLDDRERQPDARLRARVDAHASILPAALRNEAIFGSAVQLVEEVAALRQELARQSVAPADVDARIDERLRRGGFSLRGDRAAAPALIRRLVRRPDAARAMAPRVVARCETWLAATPDEHGLLDGRVERRIRLGDRVDAAALRAALGVADAAGLEGLGGRFRLVAHAGGRSEAVARVVGEEPNLADGHVYARYRIDPLPAAPGHALAAWRTVRLGAESSLADVPAADLPGGESLPAEDPWTFADGDVTTADASRARRLVGVGDARVAGPTALVALPPGAAVDAAAATRFEPAGMLYDCCGGGDADARLLHRVAGRLEVRVGAGDDTQAFRIETGVPDERGADYRLVGRRAFPAGPDGGVCWLGLPEVDQLSEAGIFRTVPDAQLRWRPVGHGGGWRSRSSAAVGEVAIRVVDDAGFVRFATRCNVLPAGATFRGREEGHGRGRLTIAGLGPVVAARAADEVEGTHFAAGVARPGVVELIAEGDGVARKLRVELEWPQGRARLAVANPVPIRGFRAGERRLAPGWLVTPRDLISITAEASGIAEPLLTIEGDAMPLARLRREHPDDPWRLPLRPLEDLLLARLAARGNGTRSQVVLRLETPGGNAAQVSLQLRWTAAELRTRPARRAASSDELAVSADQPAAGAEQQEAGAGCEMWVRHGGGGGEGIEIELRPLAEPDAAPVMATPFTEAIEPAAVITRPAGVPAIEHASSEASRIGGAFDAGIVRAAEANAAATHAEASAAAARPPEVRHGWRFDFAGRRPGAWLAIACRGGAPIAPARLVAVPGHGGSAPDALAALVDEADPERRMSRWLAAAAAMGADAAHPLWPAVEAMAVACGRVPPETFDALRAIAATPSAAALLVARSPARESILERFEERLPLTWAALPATAWRDAFVGWGTLLRRELVAKAGLEDDAAAALVQRQLKDVIDAICKPDGLRAACVWAARQIEASIRPDYATWAKGTPPRAACPHVLGQFWRQVDRRPPDLLSSPREARCFETIDGGPPFPTLLPESDATAEERNSWFASAPMLSAGVAVGRLEAPAANSRAAVAVKLCRAYDPDWFGRAVEVAFAALVK